MNLIKFYQLLYKQMYQQKQTAIKPINYNSQNLEEWAEYSLKNGANICHVSVDRGAKIKINDGKLTIASGDSEVYFDSELYSFALSQPLKISKSGQATKKGIEPTLFCSFDCNKSEGTTTTDNFLSKFVVELMGQSIIETQDGMCSSMAEGSTFKAM